MSEKELNNLIEKMYRVEGLLRRYQMLGMRAFGPLANTHRGQGRVLSLLKMQPEISQKELSYLLDMRQQSLSELLAKLEQKGYITRTPSEDDRRTTIVKLTEAGRTAAEEADQKEMDLNGIFSCLSQEEQDNFGNYLDRIADALEKESDDMDINWKNFGMGMGWGRGGHGAPPPPHHHGHGHNHDFGGGRRGFGGRGGRPGDIPGAERFDPDYDGPTPEGREGFGGPAPEQDKDNNQNT